MHEKESKLQDATLLICEQQASRVLYVVPAVHYSTAEP